MKLGNFRNFFIFFLFFTQIALPALSDDKVESVPLINLEELSPTFDEDKDILEKMEDKSITTNNSENVSDDSKSLKSNKKSMKIF